LKTLLFHLNHRELKGLNKLHLLLDG
jgi:hypothetical protein